MFAEAALKEALRSGEFTDDMVEQAVKDITDQFGDDAGRAVRNYIDDLRVETRLAPAGGLAAHEAAGGHTIDRHVGKTDADLINRLQAEPHISGASTWANRSIAEEVVADVLARSAADIQTWLSGNRVQLIINDTTTTVIGRYVPRGSTTAMNVSGVRIVVRRDPSLPTGYRIHSAFPKP